MQTYSSYLAQYLPFKVQKISINAGFTCPNRDGKISFGGCTYCNNQSFNPDYCRTDKSVTQQLKEGIQFFARKSKYAELRYLAYFQAYTNTYAPTDRLKELYEEALAVDKVAGIVIGTRPDCMPPDLLDYLADLSRHTFVMIEYGVESTIDATLLRINRGHDFACCQRTISLTAERGIHTAAHLILGLPGESRADLLSHADRISSLPIEVLKLHQLQIVRGSAMAQEYAKNPDSFSLMTPEEYIALLADFLPRLRKDVVVERFVSQTPADILIAPHWGLKNYEFEAKLRKAIPDL